MEKKNLKANDFNMDSEIKKVQEEYINEMKSENMQVFDLIENL